MVVVAASHEMDDSEETAKTGVRGERKTRIEYKNVNEMDQYV